MLLIILKSLFVLLNLIIGLYDFSFYRIPNMLLAALLVLYALFAPLYFDLHTIFVALMTGATALVICIGLYVIKIIGAGDAKYLSVISLWAGFPGIITFLFYMALLGGVIAVFFIIFRDHLARASDTVWKFVQKMEKEWPLLQKVWMGSGQGAEKGKREKIDVRMVPYGVAIAGGAIIMICLHS